MLSVRSCAVHRLPSLELRTSLLCYEIITARQHHVKERKGLDSSILAESDLLGFGLTTVNPQPPALAAQINEAGRELDDLRFELEIRRDSDQCKHNAMEQPAGLFSLHSLLLSSSEST